jgi:Tol biopolymer transport system component
MLQVYVNNVAGNDERALTDNEMLNWCPYWHPSGKWLIFTRADFRGRPNFDLYLIRDDGSETHRVTTHAAFDGLPVFSPDGRYLMWTSKRNRLDSPQIFLAEFVGLTRNGELLAPGDE